MTTTSSTVRSLRRQGSRVNQRQDDERLRLRYRRPAVHWTDGLQIGDKAGWEAMISAAAAAGQR